MYETCKVFAELCAYYISDKQMFARVIRTSILVSTIYNILIYKQLKNRKTHLHLPQIYCVDYLIVLLSVYYLSMNSIDELQNRYYVFNSIEKCN